MKSVGIKLSCFNVEIGFKPGIMGTLIPSSLHKSTNSKYFLLSKNI